MISDFKILGGDKLVSNKINNVFSDVGADKSAALLILLICSFV